MKILWFNHRDLKHPLAGGAERTIYEVSKRLVSSGYDVNLVSVNPGGLEESEILDGINVFRIKGNIRAHLAVPRMIGKVKPDVIVDDLAHVAPWLSPLFTKRRVIVFFRHLHARSLRGQIGPVSSRIFGLIEKTYKLIYRNNLFVTELELGVNDLIKLGIRIENIKRIMPGIDRNLFRPCEKTPYPLLLYFGGLKDYKRPWLSLELLKTLGRSDVKLRILGNGPSLNRVRELSEAYNLSESVEFLGRISNDDLPHIICESWINLHFSVTEGFGYTLIESASCAIPTVALDAPGVTEVIRKFGIGVVEKDVEKMSEDKRGIEI